MAAAFLPAPAKTGVLGVAVPEGYKEEKETTLTNKEHQNIYIIDQAQATHTITTEVPMEVTRVTVAAEVPAAAPEVVAAPEAEAEAEPEAEAAVDRVVAGAPAAEVEAAGAEDSAAAELEDTAGGAAAVVVVAGAGAAVVVAGAGAAVVAAAVVSTAPPEGLGVGERPHFAAAEVTPEE